MKSTPNITEFNLLKKGKKKLISLIFSRTTLIMLLLIIQLAFLFGIFYKFEEFLFHFWIIDIIFLLSTLLYLLNSTMNPTAKITWLVILMLVPVFGALLYIYIQSDLGHRTLKKHSAEVILKTRHALRQNEYTLNKLQNLCPGVWNLSRYIRKSGCYPVYTNTDVKYFPLGENMFKEMLFQLKVAEHFIFMEYFIIGEGHMWGEILEILALKAAQGVEIRVMYDGTCEFSTLPYNYPAYMRKLGISCKAFAPLSPFFSTHYNYRDHRKILVIDGHTAFTGGVNLADEYINHTSRFGHWKDTAVMLKGEAVASFTLMFLQMWHLKDKSFDYHNYLSPSETLYRKENGFVIPYGDTPVDDFKVGEQVYIDILNRAEKYVHIMSPYLILDGEMESALIYAANRGIDVKLILPGIPDKKIPYSLAYTHYSSLLKAGVKIAEYTPGFIHAKIFVSDNREAVVGTINLDYRSLYHHFECAVYLWKVKCITEIENDYNITWEKSSVITRQNMKKAGLFRKITGFVLKPLGPLM